MLSSNVIRAYALFVAPVNANPCRPTTTSLATTEITSAATVIDSTADFSSKVVESATETGMTDFPATTSVVVEEPTTTTAAAGTVVPPCHTTADCGFNAFELCFEGLLDLCICLADFYSRVD
ncbi:hypothetical protein FLAG1_09171 [Fusarium langsethiae]|uniref:Uncharacterized protein n=1 Tax=Fusarium langsethiae TaxID=179993 RepID=A0A0M9ERA6_FUSLA|nr:hypothetical protein FLAG1_09171 [Fusarium langsethiae]GKU06197.1 unnamed protein product [Fusarium langsethiae]GKU22017.1 unnamed protein product [Fusarium langsethiae]